MQILANLDLAKNELQNARIQNLAADPSNPVPGQIWYSTVDKTFYGWNATSKIDLGQVLTGASIVTLINACSSLIDDDNLSTNVADALTKRHSHSNSVVLNAMEAAFTNALKTKLDGLSNYTHPTGDGNLHVPATGTTNNGKVLKAGATAGSLSWGTLSKSDVGLSAVDNKSSVTIRSEITSVNVTAALGFTPVKDGGNTPELREGSEASRPAATGSGLIFFATDTKKIWKDTGAWTQMGGQDLQIASSNVLGGIKVGANLTIDAEGKLNANDNPSSFLIRQETFTVGVGQTTFNLTKGSYKPGTNSLFWYLFGQKQENGALIESSPSSFQILGDLEEGMEIMVEYIEVLNSHPFPYHASEHLSTGVDPIPDATTSQDGLMSAADKVKLNGIAAGAQANQNAFSNVKVGSTTVSADSSTDTLELVAGTNISLAADTANDKVTINNTYVHPATHPPSIIAQDTSNRFVSDTEKSAWNAKETPAGAQSKADAALASANSYTDTKVAALVASAPGTLDTLNELAAALGDDPNFATTMTNLVATRAKKATASIGDGTATVFNISHGLGTLDTTFNIREISTGSMVFVEAQNVDANTLRLTFPSAPSLNQYRVTITG